MTAAPGHGRGAAPGDDTGAAPGDGTGAAPVDVLVVGAGPTGLALAAQVHAHGGTVRVVDRSADRVHESRALGVQPRTLEVLTGPGVARTLVARGNPALRLALHAGRKVVPLPLFDLGMDDTDYPFLLFVSQAVTEQVLVEHLAADGVAVEREVELVDCHDREGQVSCGLRHRDGGIERAQARYLAGCDGAHSTVREQAGIRFAGSAYPQTFALADLEVDGLAAGMVHAYLGASGPLFFFPLGEPASWRMITMRPASGWPGGSPDPDRAATLDDLQAVIDAATGTGTGTGTATGERLRLRLRLRDPVWLTDFRLHRRHAARYRAGRIFLAGDAAHVHSPAGAQGMNTGIQDAWNLGWKLALVARGLAAPALLDTYHTERAPVGRAVVRFTDRAFRVATSNNPLLRGVRRQLVPRLVPLAQRFPRVRAAVFRTIAELDINYRRSGAVQEGHPAPRRGPRAGDRLPAAAITVHGTRCSLHEAIGAPGFHLLLCGPAERWAREEVEAIARRYAGMVSVHHLTAATGAGEWRDIDGQALHRLGLRRATGEAAAAVQYLVRPDGHVSYRVAGTDLTGLHRHLSSWLPGR